MPIGGFDFHKETIGCLVVLCDILGIFLMIYVVWKLEQVNKDYADIIDANQITMKDFSVMCKDVLLDKYTQDAVLIKMKIWLHFRNLLEEFKIEGNDQEVVDVTLSMVDSP
jgi:hypothetical protein